MGSHISGTVVRSRTLVRPSSRHHKRTRRSLRRSTRGRGLAERSNVRSHGVSTAGRVPGCIIRSLPAQRPLLTIVKRNAPRPCTCTRHNNVIYMYMCVVRCGYFFNSLSALFVQNGHGAMADGALHAVACSRPPQRRCNRSVRTCTSTTSTRHPPCCHFLDLPPPRPLPWRRRGSRRGATRC